MRLRETILRLNYYRVPLQILYGIQLPLAEPVPSHQVFPKQNDGSAKLPHTTMEKDLVQSHGWYPTIPWYGTAWRTMGVSATESKVVRASCRRCGQTLLVHTHSPWTCVGEIV